MGKDKERADEESVASGGCDTALIPSISVGTYQLPQELFNRRVFLENQFLVHLLIPSDMSFSFGDAERPEK